jgi:DNA repair photolyase
VGWRKIERMTNKPMNVGELRDKIKDIPDDTPIDFGCQCDSFDRWEAHIRMHRHFISDEEDYLGFYLIRGKNANNLTDIWENEE